MALPGLEPGFLVGQSHFLITIPTDLCKHKGNLDFYTLPLFCAVTQLVWAHRYKPAVRGFDSRGCQWNFFIDIILPAAL